MILTRSLGFRVKILQSLLFFLLSLLPVIAFAQPPGFSKTFIPSTIGPGSTTSLVFTITNGDAFPITDLAFTDTLPAGVTLADPVIAENSCDGTLMALNGGSSISLTGGQISASTSCIITVAVTSSATGAHTNTSDDLTSSEGNSGSATANLTVSATLPGFSKSFSPNSVSFGGRSTLTFTIDNSQNDADLTQLAFVDNLPAGMVIADPANATTTCGTTQYPATLVALAGTSTISLSAVYGYTFPGPVYYYPLTGGATCTVEVDVTANIVGSLENSSLVLSTSSGISGKANASLEVTADTVYMTKSFTNDPASPGGTVDLTFTIANSDRGNTATNISFTDDLESTLTGLVATGLPQSDVCGPGSILSGTSLLSLTGGNLAPEGSCTFTVTLQVPAGAATGAYPNITSPLTVDLGGSPQESLPVSDTLFVAPLPLLTKTFSADTAKGGDTVDIAFTITNTSADLALSSITFTDTLSFAPTSFLITPSSNPCGTGSTFLNNISDGNVLTLSNGQLAADTSCTFTATIGLPANMPFGTYTNTTSTITGTFEDTTPVIGPAATDTIDITSGSVLLSKSFVDDPVAPGGTVTLEFTLTNPTETYVATDITFTDDLNAALTGLAATGLPQADICGAGSSLTGSTGDTLLTLVGGSLGAGESCTFSVTLDIPAGTAPGTYTNTTSDVSATVGGQTVTSTAASDTLNIAGISFTKEFIDDPVIAGGQATLSFTIKNVHPSDDATAIEFTDDLSTILPGTQDVTVTGLPMAPCGPGSSITGTTSLTFSGGELIAGASCTFDVTLFVPTGTADGSYNNTTGNLTATQGGGGVEIDPATDILVVDSNRLQLAKSFTDDPVAPGNSVTLEFTLTNLDATQGATGIAFTDDLSATLPGLTFASVGIDTCGGTVTGQTTTTITAEAISLAAGASCTIQTALAVPDTATPGIYTNTTSAVSGTIGGLSVTGDAISDNLEIINLLGFSKSFNGPSTATGVATLTFTITNPGSSIATDIAFTDDLNAVIPGLVATSLPPYPCGFGSSVTGTTFLAFTGGEVGAGGQCSFVVDVAVPASTIAGTYSNSTSDLTRNGLKFADPATADFTIEPPPTFAKTFTPDFIPLNQPSSLTFTIDNSASSLGASSLDFADNLPAGVVVASPANASTTCIGGILTAVNGSGSISYTGGTVGAGVSCTIQVDVTSSSPGLYENFTGDLTSSSGNSGAATDTLQASTPPAFSKAFSPGSILRNQISTLTFTIDNSVSTREVTGLDFTDNLPAGVVVATPANASTDCTGGTLTATDGSGFITYTGGSVNAGSTCTVQVDVSSGIAGSHVNITGDLTSSMGSSGTAGAILSVIPPPGFSKSFSPDTIHTGGISTLTFTIDNSISTREATALDFTDNLPAGVVVATPANAASNCSGGTLLAVSGTEIIDYSNGAIAAGTICTVSVDITSDQIGIYLNTSGVLGSSAGNSNFAAATLTVRRKVFPWWSFLPSLMKSVHERNQTK